MALGLLAWLGVMAPGCATLERPSGMASDGLEKKKKMADSWTSSSSSNAREHAVQLRHPDLPMPGKNTQAQAHT